MDPTVNNLANSPSSTAPACDPDEGRLFSLTATQRRIWLFEQFRPGTPFFNMPIRVRLTGPLRPDLLRRAFEATIARHDALRLRFENLRGIPLQAVDDASDFELPLVDLSEMQASEREARIAALAAEEARPFDLRHGGLFRAKLLRCGPEDHILASSTHHIVFDGWSVGLLLREVAHAYGALVAGRNPFDRKLPLQFREFIRQQEYAAAAGEHDRHLAYWRAHLGEDIPTTELPLDSVRPAVTSFEAAVVTLNTGPELGRRLRALSQAQGVTLFVTLLGAFNVLLGRYTGQDDVIVGTPFAARNSPGARNVVGVLMNTLPIRTSLMGNPTFRELVAKLGATIRGAQEHEDVPFERVLEDLGLADGTRPPVFQILFNMMNFRQSVPGDTGGVNFELQAILHQTARFDLTVYVRSMPDDSVLVEGVYRKDLFSHPAMSALLNRYAALLRRFVSDPDAPVQEISVLTDEEVAVRGVARGLTAGPADHVRFPDSCETSIGARFSAVVALHPDRVAVRTDAYEWTYRELSRRVAAVASAVTTDAMRSAERIALIFGHDAPAIAALLGCLQAGRTYVPIDARLPPARMGEILKDADVGAILCDEAHRSTADEVAGGRTVLAFTDVWNANCAARPLDHGSPDNLAYLLYTSGSTGAPKAVMQSHRNVLHFIQTYTNNLRIASSDRLSLFSAYTFDAAVMDIFGALLNGAMLLPRDVREQGLRLDKWIADQGVTIYHSTPTLYRQFLAGQPERERLEGVRLVVLGGEAVLRSDVEQGRRAFGRRCVFVNGLGPTESTVSLQHFLNADTPLDCSSVPVGYPVEGTEVVLLDPNGKPAELHGEIGIRSRHVALGYWKRPELTAAAFWRDPADPALRTYRSGDIGRRRWDGMIEFLGRRDDQVKIRGFRIELGEIESALSALPTVSHAAVVARKRSPQTDELSLYAFVVCPAAAFDPETVRTELRARLPEYMIPAAIVRLDTLPMTNTGKVNRRALPNVEHDRPRARARVEPQTSTEQVLAAIWAEVLGVVEVGRDDDFFSLGGHSLSAARLVYRVEQLLSVHLSLRTVFEAPSLRELAAHIEAAGDGKTPGTARPALTRIPRTGPLPLSFAQERLWFLQQLWPESSAYHMATAVKVNGRLDGAAFRGAWELVTRRHESFRTRIRQTEGQPFAEICDEPLLDYADIDLRSEPEGDRIASAVERIRVLVDRPFDLSEGPLLRVLLARVGEEEYVNGVVLHHIVADHWSVAPLMRDLAQAYACLAARRQPDLPPLPVQYVDYARWQREVLHQEEMERQLAFWRGKLDGLESLDLPVDHPRIPGGTNRGARATATIPLDTLTALRALCQAEGVTLSMALLAGFNILLMRHTGREDVAVGCPISNRAHAELEHTVGMFVNILVLRSDLTQNPTGRELLRRVRDVALDAYAHQDLPFERLVSELRVTREVNEPPLLRAVFNVHNAPVERKFIEGLELAPLEFERLSAQFDLSFLIEPELTRAVSAEYAADLFERSTVERMLGHYLRLLEALAASPDAPISTLPMMSEAEVEQVVVGWNATARPYDRNVSIDALLEERAALVTDKIAVRSGTAALTYGELHARASVLAGELQRAGVGPEVPVGVCLERGLHLPVAMLGVLKSGGAYVPLDPAFPADRLSYMLADSGARVLVTAGQAARGVDTSAVATIDLAREVREEAAPGERLASYPGGERLAYIMYTSGSTGRPKGVQVVHRAVVNFLHSMAAQPGFAQDDVLLSVTTPSFDIFGLELFLPLYAGGSIVIARRDETTDGTRLSALLEEHAVTVMQATPATWRLMLDAGWTGSPRLKVLCGGEAMSRELADELLLRAAEVWNLYGPTETTIWSTVDRVLTGDRVTIGRPIANTQIYILDDRLRPVATGVRGEVCIGGDGVARGYLGRPELTADRFVRDPFAAREGARLYRTGDLGRWLRDGRLDVLGRADHQVKLRGFRIELGEIEAVLDRHEAVRQSAAVVHGEEADRRLIAYVTYKAGVDATASDLRRFARTYLPEYMVPSLFMVLDAMPLTPNGKVNRGALPGPFTQGRPEAARVPPRTPTEAVIAGIWGRLLGRDDISIHDNFFDIGGHSLLSMEAIASIEKLTGVRLNPARFMMDTLEQIGATCDEISGGAEAMRG